MLANASGVDLSRSTVETNPFTGSPLSHASLFFSRYNEGIPADMLKRVQKRANKTDHNNCLGGRNANGKDVSARKGSDFKHLSAGPCCVRASAQLPRPPTQYADPNRPLRLAPLQSDQANDSICVWPRNWGACKLVNASSKLTNDSGVVESLAQQEVSVPDHSIQQPILIEISNVVCSFSTGCKLNLRQIAIQGVNVVYRRSSGKVVMCRRYPLRGMANIYASGKVSCFGCNSEDTAYKLSRQVACSLKKTGVRQIRFCDFRVVNVFSQCKLPFTVNLGRLITQYQNERKKTPRGSDWRPYGISHAFYEPELHPGATIKIKQLNVTLKLFSTGSMTIIGPDSEAPLQACNLVYPLLCLSK